jgi:mannose-6-phosphate isomerase-like protein (cupin superfamily)
MRPILFAAVLLAATPAFAQTAMHSAGPDSFKFMSRDDIDKMISKPEPGRAYGATFMNDHENYYVEFVKRLDHGNMVEQHPHWVDQVTIVAGEGILTYGGTIEHPNVGAGGEVRGGNQVGAKTQTLKPGDFVLIPAGLPHSFNAAPGKTLTYAVFKARS